MVYLAHDLRRDRGIALEVLCPGLAAKGTAPHMLSLFDSGDAEGFLSILNWFVHHGAS